MRIGVSSSFLRVQESVKYIQDHLTAKIDLSNKSVLLNIAKTTISSKLIGAETEYFSELVVKAILAVRMVSEVAELTNFKSFRERERETRRVPVFLLLYRRRETGTLECVSVRAV